MVAQRWPSARVLVLVLLVTTWVATACGTFRDSGSFEDDEQNQDTLLDVSDADGFETSPDVPGDTPETDTDAVDMQGLGFCGDGICDPAFESHNNCCDDCPCVGVFTCDANRGQCGCEDTLTACGSACVDTTSDPANCAVCDLTCDDNEGCTDSRCVCEVSDPALTERDCDLAASETCCAGEGCVDLANNTATCGSCDNACNPGESCRMGNCRCGLGGTCGDDDNGNDLVCCGGGCCAVGELCCNGACLPPSDPQCSCGTEGSCSPTALCCPDSGSERCAEPASDDAHCGACGEACGSNSKCSNGSCECLAPYGDCNGNGCDTDLDTDNDNCGACGVTCGGLEVCVGGVCTCPLPSGSMDVCPGDQACCSEGCTDLETDPMNCTACGTICEAGSTCNGGCSCPGGLVCNGQCVNVTSNPVYCNGCDPYINDCTQHPNTTDSACGGGRCFYDCVGGYLDCNSTEPGCETELGTEENCGACGDTCGAFEECTNNACTLGTWVMVQTTYLGGGEYYTVAGEIAFVPGTNTWQGLLDDSDNNDNILTTGTLIIDPVTNAVSLESAGIKQVGQVDRDGNLIATNGEDSVVQTTLVRRVSGHTTAELSGRWSPVGYRQPSSGAPLESFKGKLHYDNTQGNLRTSGSWLKQINSSSTQITPSVESSVVYDQGRTELAIRLGGVEERWKGWLDPTGRVMILLWYRGSGNFYAGHIVVNKQSSNRKAIHFNGDYFVSRFEVNPTPTVSWGTISGDGSILTGGALETHLGGTISVGSGVLQVEGKGLISASYTLNTNPAAFSGNMVRESTSSAPTSMMVSHAAEASNPWLPPFFPSLEVWILRP